MATAKERAKTLLQRLPDDCTFDDIHYHLYVIEKIGRGLESAEKEGTISQAEMEHWSGKMARACERFSEDFMVSREQGTQEREEPFG